MGAGYHRRLERLAGSIGSPTLTAYARMPGSNSFSRRRKMPLGDILLSSLAHKGLSTAMELRCYFNQKGCDPMAVSKQGYLQQRKKLNPEVFAYLNREYLIDFYASEEPLLWNGFLVFAIDGSKAEVPNSDENHKTFGKSSNGRSEGQPRALVSGMYDVLNDFFVDIQIGGRTDSEAELARHNILAFKELMPDAPTLAVLDRGYPSIALIDFLEEQGVDYLFRLPAESYKKEREAMAGDDEAVVVAHTGTRLATIRRRDPEAAARLKEKGHTCTRIVNLALPSGKRLTLMTSLAARHSGKEVADLYYMRWGIEKKFHTLKNKLKLESVTGKASIYVYQDFWARVLAYNMIQDMRHAADEGVRKKAAAKGYKNPVRSNENMAIGLFKEGLIQVMLEQDPDQRRAMLLRLQESMEAYILPVRECRGSPRQHNTSNKYKNNQKSSF